MASDDIIEFFIKPQINTNYIPYDDFIILGTFGIIICSNTEYIEFLNENKGTNDWNYYNAQNIFGFVSEKLLKTTANPISGHEKSSDFTADFDISFNDVSFNAGFTVHFDTKVNDESAFDAETTKKKFNTAFVNLAQVFYETGFCNSFTIINNKNNGIDDASFKKFLQNKYEQAVFKKSIQLIYYKDLYSNQTRAKLEEKNFEDYKNIEFEDFRIRKKLKKNILKDYKQNIIVYDVRIIDEKKIQTLLRKFINFNNYYLLIIINDNGNVTNITFDSSDSNKQILQLKFNSDAAVSTATSTATSATATPATATATATPATATATATPATEQKDIKTITFKGCNPTVHDCTYFETILTKNKKLIEYKQKEDLDKILDYFIQTNNIVLIEHDTIVP
jgi:hypothetical protein